MISNRQEEVSPEAIDELVFSLSDTSYPFVGVSDKENCQVQLEKMLDRGQGR